MFPVKKLILVLSGFLFLTACSSTLNYLSEVSLDSETNLTTQSTEIVYYDNFPPGTTLLANNALEAYVADGRKWEKYDLTYYFQNMSDDLTSQETKEAFEEAFGLWAAYTKLTFTEVTNSGDADIVILFSYDEHGDDYPFDSSTNVLAHAFFPPPNLGELAGDAHFNENKDWTKYDLVSVAAHEIGHSLGLKHSSDSEALMYYRYNGKHRYLHEDDVAGITSIYGTNLEYSPNQILGIAVDDDNDHFFTYFDTGIKTEGQSYDLDGFGIIENFSLPDGYTPYDIVAIAMDEDTNHFFTYFRDGKKVEGTSYDLDRFGYYENYSLPPGYTPDDIVGIGMDGGTNYFTTFFRDGMKVEGTSYDLDRFGHYESYSLPNGYTPDDIVAIALAGHSNHFVTYFKDGKKCEGASYDLDKFGGLETYTLP